MILLYLIVGIGLLLLLLATARWYAAAPPQHVLTGLRWLAYLGGGGAALWLLLSGRAVQILYLLIPALPLIRRWIGRRWTATPAAGGQSDVETPWLRMTLDHAAATMDGIVLQGPLQGRKLSELRADDLFDLLARLRVEHAESATLLETYLDAVHAGWRSTGPDERRRPAEARDEMSREEAFRILGLEPGAGPEAIRQAWREAMKRNHPDQGGSPYLAAKINRAKELLLDT